MRWAIEEKEYSQRRACSLVGLAPKVYRHRSRRADDGVLRTRLKELAAVRRRFGYRRLQLLLRREGWAVNHKKLYRIYREERLVVRKRGGRKRGGRKRALGTRAPIALPGGRNERWSLDFVSDALADGRRVDDNRTKKQRLDAGKSFKAPGCPEGSIPEGATRRCGNQICTAKGGHRYCRPA